MRKALTATTLFCHSFSSSGKMSVTEEESKTREGGRALLISHSLVLSLSFGLKSKEG